MEYRRWLRKTAERLRQAVAHRPAGRGTAQGLLAFALTDNADNVNTGRVAVARRGTPRSSGVSLRADPGQSQCPTWHRCNSSGPRSTWRGPKTGSVPCLRTAPDNFFAMRLLWNLLQSAGRSREALQLVERAISIRPLRRRQQFSAGAAPLDHRANWPKQTVSLTARCGPGRSTASYVSRASRSSLSPVARVRRSRCSTTPRCGRRAFPRRAVALWRVGYRRSTTPPLRILLRSPQSSRRGETGVPSSRPYAVLDLVITWRSRCRSRDCKRPAWCSGRRNRRHPERQWPTAGQQHSLEISRRGCSRRP